jgi:small-conductance mechanosensitive channel
VSIAVFAMYFVALGLVLKEFGISLTAYFASATIIGLAVGFGSQGLVQDVVTGLTVVFSDLFDVGDMVEIAGQTGIVQKIGIRFTVLINFMGAEVFIPNRTIANVVKYERGYIRLLADITLPPEQASAGRVEERAREIVESTKEQFPGILMTPPSIEGRYQTSSGKEFLRVKFRIWPGQGGPLEASFKREVVESLKIIDSTYSDWMVVLTYEVEKKPATVQRPVPRRPKSPR